MDQLIFASLSQTHYWYEGGMLKIPAVFKLCTGSGIFFLSYVRVARVPSRQNVGRSIVLVTFGDRLPSPSSVLASSPPPTAAFLPVVTNSNETDAKNVVTRAGVKNYCVSEGTMVESEYTLDPSPP